MTQSVNRPLTVRRPRPDRICNLDRLVWAMKERDLDAVIAFQRPNVYYLSGFAAPSAQSTQDGAGATAVLIPREDPENAIVLVGDYLMPYFGMQPTWISDIRPYSSNLLPNDEVTPEDLSWFAPASISALPWMENARRHYRSEFSQVMREAIDDLHLAGRRIGMDAVNRASLVDNAHEVVDAFGLFRFVRQVKTDAERVLLRDAATLNQRALQSMVDSWRPGST